MRIVKVRRNPSVLFIKFISNRLINLLKDLEELRTISLLIITMLPLPIRRLLLMSIVKRTQFLTLSLIIITWKNQSLEHWKKIPTMSLKNNSKILMILKLNTSQYSVICFSLMRKKVKILKKLELITILKI